MKNSFLNLINVEKSIELTNGKMSNNSIPSFGSQKKVGFDNQKNAAEITFHRSPFSNELNNFKKRSSLEISEQMEETFNEGLIQKKVEMRLVKIKFPFPVISPFGNFIKVWNFI